MQVCVRVGGCLPPQHSHTDNAQQHHNKSVRHTVPQSGAAWYTEELCTCICVCTTQPPASGYGCDAVSTTTTAAPLFVGQSTRICLSRVSVFILGCPVLVTVFLSCTPTNTTVTVVDSGAQALDILRRSAPGTFQLILTVSSSNNSSSTTNHTTGQQQSHQNSSQQVSQPCM